jgi:hypothetical protein
MLKAQHSGEYFVMLWQQYPTSANIKDTQLKILSYLLPVHRKNLQKSTTPIPILSNGSILYHDYVSVQYCMVWYCTWDTTSTSLTVVLPDYTDTHKKYASFSMGPNMIYLVTWLWFFHSLPPINHHMHTENMRTMDNLSSSATHSPTTMAIDRQILLTTNPFSSITLSPASSYVFLCCVWH